ncbi:Rha family transcriptional regulator [Pectobacterium brasiliense]|uniref:Rha family transcriptional regulator n=1 Tax=Pectobacterium brasiliense TaxID=180957 RepID=UPI00193DA45E|nr:Rha family transcriptional regulator [Pectobacterium brasiliense]QRN34922.1 Rha family transcriptional regulator [Pectobacterium brasiliense]
MNTTIINLDQMVSMTSLEIAELTGKRHDNIVRDIRRMLDDLNAPNEINSNLRRLTGVEEDVYLDDRGRHQPYYKLDRKHTFILVAGYSVQLRAKCFDHIEKLEREVLRLEDQQKRVAIQSANRRGVTWGDFCKTHGLPAQRLMTILKQERRLFQVSPYNGEWSVNPHYEDCFRVIKRPDNRFSAKGINIRFNAKGLETFSAPEKLLKFRQKLVIRYGSDLDKQRLLQDEARMRKAGIIQ